MLSLFKTYPPESPQGKAIFETIEMIPAPDDDFSRETGVEGYVANTDRFSLIFYNHEKKEYYKMKSIEELRDNQDVVKHLVQYGPRKASSHCSALSIAYVPPGFTYRIMDHDGMETVIFIPPMEDICQDLLDYIALPDRGRFRSQFSQDLINGKITVKDIKEIEAQARKKTLDDFIAMCRENST